MQRYLLQRLALVPVTVLAVCTAVFLLVRLLPGDIITILTREAPQYGDAPLLRHQLGLDVPLLTQFGRFLGHTVQGNFGTSLYYRRPVSRDLSRALPITLELTLLAVTLSSLIAIPLGIVAAVRPNGWVDYTVRLASVVFQAVPGFWLGTLVLTALALWAHWTPPLRYTPFWSDPLRNLQQFLLPAAVLGLGASGLKLRLVRSQMLAVLSQDYMRTARAKGLGRRLLVQRHALRNAMVPVVAIIGGQIGVLLGGAAVAETIFNLPGLGRLLVDAVGNRDYPTVQAAVLVIALCLVLLNLAVDLVYAWLDPRIRYAR